MKIKQFFRKIFPKKIVEYRCAWGPVIVGDPAWPIRKMGWEVISKNVYLAEEYKKPEIKSIDGETNLPVTNLEENKDLNTIYIFLGDVGIRDIDVYDKAVKMKQLDDALRAIRENKI